MNRTGTNLGKLTFPYGERIINQINHGTFKGSKHHYTFPQVSKLTGVHKVPTYLKITDHKAKVSYTIQDASTWDKSKIKIGWRFQVIKRRV